MNNSELPQNPQNHRSFSKWQKYASFAVVLFFIVFIVIFLSRPREIKPIAPIIEPTALPRPSSSRAEDQIIIKYKEGVTEEAISESLKKYNVTIIKRIDAIRYLVIHVPLGQVDAILNEMEKDNLIDIAEPDYIRQVFYTPNDPSFKHQWGLVNTGQLIKGWQGKAKADIDAPSAWDITQGNGIKVAIIDTGIDVNHPDLSIKIIAQKDFSNNNSIRDGLGHGTHAAGVVAAVTNNSVGVAGTCPGCLLLIAKALNDNGSGLDSWQSEAIIWAADNGAKVINMSFGGPNFSIVVQDAINYAWNKGAVSVAASGNQGGTFKNYPAANQNVVSVASTDNTDTKASFANYGTWVDVSSPGVNIYSTLPTYPFNLQQKQPGTQTDYDYVSGTSMSTPIASGVVALIWASVHGTSAQAVVRRLFDTTDKISGTGQYWTYGRVNALKAVALSLPATPLPTLTQIAISPTPIPSPTGIYATPTLYCLGSCPTVPVTPTFILLTQQPTLSTILTQIPSASPLPTHINNQPTPTQTPVPINLKNKGLLNLIIEMILKIIELILKLFRL